MGPPAKQPKDGVWESTENQGRRKWGRPRWDVFWFCWRQKKEKTFILDLPETVWFDPK